MARLIHNEIKKPLAEELLFGRLRDGGRLVITVADNKLSIEIEEPVSA
jgi:ATP-dependent Clp protease ATP-binding subunit ClpA